MFLLIELVRRYRTLFMDLCSIPCLLFSQIYLLIIQYAGIFHLTPLNLLLLPLPGISLLLLNSANCIDTELLGEVMKAS